MRGHLFFLGDLNFKFNQESNFIKSALAEI